MPATRSSLLSRVRDFDDASGWVEFDKLYRPILVEYAQRRGLGLEGAEEVAQQCLTAIVGRIRSFKRSGSFRGWLRGMVEHKVADHLADRAKSRRADTDLLAQSASPELPPMQVWCQQWNLAHLQYVMADVGNEFARHTIQAFALYVLHGRPATEIGGMLGMTPNQVYVAKSRVLRRIRERFPELADSLYEVVR